MNKFSVLFKKYRLRAEFETLSQLGVALAEKGYVYEDSIYSHWQKGTRLPNRDVIIKLLHIFVERQAIQTVQEANEFVESAHHGYLTAKEKSDLQLLDQPAVPFQVPCEIAHFTGREEIVERFKKALSKHRVFLLHGPPGVGKTSLAIRLGHLLKKRFPDGVLWYKVDSSNVMDILLSIARLFGEDISGIKDIEVRASVVRTLLAKKKLLLIFDNVTNQETLHLLLPNSPHTIVIFSSQENILKIPTPYMSVAITTFTQQEVFALFTTIFGRFYVKRNKTLLKELCERLGNLPLALNIVANYIKQTYASLEAYVKTFDNEQINLQTLTYEDKNLFKAITTVYLNLDHTCKLVFISLGVFEGKDFAVEAVASINKISTKEAEECLQKLQNISVIEQSKTGRYRIHPVIRAYAKEKINDKRVYLYAASYYEQLLLASKQKETHRILIQEVDNIIYIFKQCYESGYWDQIITMLNPLEKFLSDINEVKKLRQIAQRIDSTPTINKFQIAITLYYSVLVFYWIVLFGSGQQIGFWNNLFSLAYTLMPLFSGAVGIFRSRPWGLFSTNIGKAVFFTALGLFFWSIGNLIWAYYNFVEDVIAPYPSWADVSFLPAYILWTISIVYLSKSTGAKLYIRPKRDKLFLMIVPLLVISASYYFLLFVIKRTFGTDAPIKIFFDLYYPSMDIIILTLAIVIFGFSVNFFGGKYKLSLFAILFGHVFLYFADFTFSYMTSIATYYNGNYADLFFATAVFLLTWGTLSFYVTPKRNMQ